jgi:hypothetical protein
MSPELLFAVVALAGLALIVGAVVALRLGGARPGLGRRLAGPSEVTVGQLLDAEELPSRPVRVAGRIRCRDPLEPGGGVRLVAFHRDVELLVNGRWRSIERMREARSFDLWDHDGSVSVDPAAAAEPLIAIPAVWRGAPDQLEEPHASAAARLIERHGPAGGARAVTRSINVTDRLLVLAQPVRDPGGRLRLEPPDGGYLITNLALPDAMRLLGGRHRRLAALSVITIGVGIALLAIGGVAALASLVLA